MSGSVSGKPISDRWLKQEYPTRQVLGMRYQHVVLLKHHPILEPQLFLYIASEGKIPAVAYEKYGSSITVHRHNATPE